MVRIRVPATTANIGPGFDTLGMALKLYNYFEVAPAETLSVRLLPASCVETEGLSMDPADNLLCKAYQAYFNFRRLSLIPAQLGIEAHIPLSRGLGSSSTAIVAGLALANAMCPDPLDKAQLIPWAVALEGHPDNVVAALMGGIQCCFSDNTSVALAWPEDWGILLVIPPTPLETHRARAVMPKHYAVADVVETLRGIAAWMVAVDKRDATLFRYALTSDRIHQPARASLIPEFEILCRLAQNDTAVLGCVISGAGSTCALFFEGLAQQSRLLDLLKQAELLHHCKIIPVKPDCSGVFQVDDR